MSHDKIATKFDAWAQEGNAESMEDGHGDVVRQVVEKMEVAAGEKILDLGCGNGWATRMLAKMAPGVGAVGIDVSPHMIARAEELHSFTIRARYEVGAFEEMDFKDGEFDRAFSMEAIYYSVDLEQSLVELNRVLKAGGKADLIVDFFADNPGTERWGELMGITMHFLSAAEWGAALHKAGFSTVDTSRVIDSRGPGDPDSFEPNRWYPDWETKLAVHEAGSLWIHAVK